MTEQPRKVRQYVFTPEVFIGVQQGVYKVVSDELPADARRVGAGYDQRQDVFWVNIQSDSFEPILPGAAILMFSGCTVERLNQLQAMDYAS